MGEKVLNSEVEELLSELKSRYVDEDLNTILSAYDMAIKDISLKNGNQVSPILLIH